MTDWKLVVRPDGKAMLTTERVITHAELLLVQGAIDRWKTFEDGGVLILPDCAVVQVVDVDVDAAVASL